jgi:hypothetical protein
VSLGEDRCQTRTGSVPSILAQLNTAVLSLMDRLGVRNVARQMRYFDTHVEQALALPPHWFLFGLLELESPVPHRRPLTHFTVYCKMRVHFTMT